jgi:hypothetical protein
MGTERNVMRSRADGESGAALTIHAVVLACPRQTVVTLLGDHLAQGRFLLS